MEVRKKVRAAKEENVKLELMQEEVREDSRQLIAKIGTLRRELSSCSHSETGSKKTLIATNQVISQLVQYCRTNNESVLSIKEKRIFQLEKKLTNQVTESADGTRLLVNGYTFQLPKHVIERKDQANSTVSCRGCEAPLPVYRNSTRAIPVNVEYFKHLFNCPQYLDKTGKCEKCKIIFVDSRQLSSHINKTHAALPEKPYWMAKTIYQAHRFGSAGEKSCDISCPGCEKVFLAKKARGKRNITELKYIIHCIDECEEYKTLDFIATCQTCDKKFLNPRSLHAHQIKSGHRLRNDEPVREWMTKNLKRSRHNRAYNSTINCRGCGKEFPCWSSLSDRVKNVQIHRAYYVHCIEDCEEYRQLDLIRTCDKCKCKFISRRSFTLHACP